MDWMDCEATRLIYWTESEEALAWLEAASPEKLRTISGHEGSEGRLNRKSRAVAFVKKIYELGAVRVVAVDINREFPEHEDTDKLIVELPKDPEARAKIFRFHNDFALSRCWDAETPDEGGRYLMFWWD
jgi:hypothetical protein